MNPVTLLQDTAPSSSQTASSPANFKQASVRTLRADFVMLVLLCALVAANWLPRMNGPIDLRWDGSIYYILGTSLAEGKGYRLLNEPGQIESLQYPPLLPLIVAAHQRLLGTSDLRIVGPWLRFFYFIMSFGFIVFVYWLARQYVTPGYAFLAALITQFYLYTYYLSDVLYTELPFALITILFVIVNRKVTTVGGTLLSALLAAAAYFLRSAGLALLVAWVAESFLRRRFREMAFRLVLALIPFVLWQVHVATVKDSQQYRQPEYSYQRAAYQYSNVSYIENMFLKSPFVPELGRATPRNMLARIARNLLSMPAAIGQAISAPLSYWDWLLGLLHVWIGFYIPPKWMLMALLALIGCLPIAGLILLTRSREAAEAFLPLFVAASVGLLCITPFPEQFIRYLMPLTPLLAIALVFMLAVMNSWKVRPSGGGLAKIVSVLPVGVVSLIVLLQGFTLWTIYDRQYNLVTYAEPHGNTITQHLFFYHSPWRDLEAAYQWLGQGRDAGGVMATTVPHLAYLRTGLRAVLPPMETDPQVAQQQLDSVPVRYVVLDKVDGYGISQRYAEPVIHKYPNLWKRVYATSEDGALIYERVR